MEINNKHTNKNHKFNMKEDKKEKFNIELEPFTDKYVKDFYNLMKEYRKKYEEKMKTKK